jgi:hypothetical protein
MAGMNPEFNKEGTTTVEKRDRAQKVLDARIENFKIATGVQDFHPAHLKLCQEIQEAEMYRAHFAKQVEKAEAERRKREEDAKRMAALQDTVNALVASLGTFDPEVIRQKLVEAGVVKAKEAVAS